MAQFTDEYYGGSISKTKNGKIRKGHLHNTKELAKDCYDRNNHRNNDVLTVARANNLANDIITEIDKKDGWYVTNPGLTENALISQMQQKKDDSVLSYEEYLKVKDNLTPEMLLFYLALYEA